MGVGEGRGRRLGGGLGRGEEGHCVSADAETIIPAPTLHNWID